MPRFRGERTAFGFPGATATWTSAHKDAVGTAYSYATHLWFTLANGILTEVYYPRIDTPQLRDLQFLFADGADLFLEEKRDLEYRVERLPKSQGYRVLSSDRQQRFFLTKEIIAEPERSALLIRAELRGQEQFLANLGVFALCAPHLANGGSGNNACVIEDAGRELLAAQKDGTWLVLGASCTFSRLSCGYVGSSDGYSDVRAHRRMTYQFDRAPLGNVALTAQLDLGRTRDFTLALAFGDTLEQAVATLFQSLSLNYRERRGLFVCQWEQAISGRRPLERASRDGGRLYETSYALLLAHEDKTYQGAFVASLAIPWGETQTDDNGRGGYHLVWTRDMVETAMALLAAGDAGTPVRALINLAARQEADGSFPQNSWVDGKPYWKHVQLDEVALPVMLAVRLFRDGLLGQFDISAMVRQAAYFLLQRGPVTGEERWEELSGYSPSTLAAVIAAMICAAYVLRAKQEISTAKFLEHYADYVRAHLEEWTVTTNGTLASGIPRHFVRINPAKPGEVAGPGALDRSLLRMPNQPPGAPDTYPARDVVDAGFLQLVRYGILAPDDPLIVDSVKVIDQTLLRRTAEGKCWRRYNHDGYGQRPDGGPFEKWGQGGSWPLLAGERAHYELARGGNYVELIEALEAFAQPNGLLAEQIWDGEDRPEAGLFSGRPTGSATPLNWAHAEYLRLLRSCADGHVFDLVPELEDRYLKNKAECRFDYWLPMHPIPAASRRRTLRVCAGKPFRLRWTDNDWASYRDSESSSTAIGAEYCDLDPSQNDAAIEFTFFWTQRNRWEGRNYKVELR
jgi:glucoamylase